MALELATEDRPEYRHSDFEQFLAIANAIGGHADGALWDPDAGFFKDLIVTPDGQYHRIDVYSMVGLIPLFATEVIDKRLLANLPRFQERLRRHKGGASKATTSVPVPTGRTSAASTCSQSSITPCCRASCRISSVRTSSSRPTGYAASAGSTPSSGISGCCPASARR